MTNGGERSGLLTYPLVVRHRAPFIGMASALPRAALLRDMIEAVLNPDNPIQDLVVLNPEVPKELPSDKSIVLDIRVRFGDGHHVDIEMQSANTRATRARSLCY